MAARINRLQPRVRMANLSHAQPLASAATSSTSSMRLTGRALMKRNARILALYPTCPLCDAKGFVVQTTEVDHRLPLIDGGTDDESNLWALDTPCHIAKTSEEASRRARGLPMPLPSLPALKPRERKFTIA
jgi:5-methylcytosine-specific restriction endonuclease McrA